MIDMCGRHMYSLRILQFSILLLELVGENMILSWFDASEAKSFGVLLAKIVIEKMPLDGSDAKAKVKEKKKEVLLNRMALEIARFRETHKLNIYKKAKLGNAFKWALRDAGYDHAYVDTMTEWLMFRF